MLPRLNTQGELFLDGLFEFIIDTGKSLSAKPFSVWPFFYLSSCFYSCRKMFVSLGVSQFWGVI